jgi:tripartite-type tricarboxylate transporter receptor subunit TctC
MKNFTKHVLFILVALGLVNTTFAQSAYPNKSIKLIVPYATGGGSDILARQISARLQAIWGQAIVVDNRPGASGNIGSEAVVRSPNDGYTLLLQNSTMVTSAALAGKLNYDPEKDLTPIMLLGLTPMSLAAAENTKIKNLKDLVAYSKKNPNGLNYGSCGIGTPQHFMVEIIKEQTGVKATHIGYKGCAPAVTDVVGGQIQLAIVSANLVAQYVKIGRLNSVGVTTAHRYSLMPENPTFKEQGIKDMDFAVWYALMGPANLPPEIVAKLQADVNKILDEPEVKQNLSNAGVEPLRGTGSDLAKLIHNDLISYAKVVKSANIKAE